MERVGPRDSSPKGRGAAWGARPGLGFSSRKLVFKKTRRMKSPRGILAHFAAALPPAGGDRRAVPGHPHAAPYLGAGPRPQLSAPHLRRDWTCSPLSRKLPSGREVAQASEPCSWLGKGGWRHSQLLAQSRKGKALPSHWLQPGPHQSPWDCVCVHAAPYGIHILLTVRAQPLKGQGQLGTRGRCLSRPVCREAPSPMPAPRAAAREPGARCGWYAGEAEWGTLCGEALAHGAVPEPVTLHSNGSKAKSKTPQTSSPPFLGGVGGLGPKKTI